MLMRIAICDDDSEHLSYVSSAIKKWNVNQDKQVICEEYKSCEDLLDDWEKGILYDLFFLDIQMMPDELSGMQLAKRIREANEHAVIVFITNFSDYVYEGYSVDALRYLRKPVVFSQIKECLDIAYNRWWLFQDNSIILEYKTQTYIFTYKAIIMIEAQGHYIKIFTTDKNSPVIIRDNIQNISQRLPHEVFVPCHRSYIVNLAYVSSFYRKMVHLTNGLEAPIAPKQIHNFQQKFNEYYQGKKF